MNVRFEFGNVWERAKTFSPTIFSTFLVQDYGNGNDKLKKKGWDVEWSGSLFSNTLTF